MQYHNAWKQFASIIKDCPLNQLHKNPAFLQTMFCSSFVKEELDYLAGFYSAQEISELVEEEVQGLSNGNNIHQLYHIANYLENTNFEYPFMVTEFGAGYGALCRLTQQTWGPAYNIIDLPELQEVQQRYLGLYGLHDKITWFNNLNQFNLHNNHNGLFVALWSLSETPQEIRDQFMEEADFTNYFFAYGESFFDMRNYDYFEEFANRRKDQNWTKIKIPFMDGQYYLIGQLK